MRQFFLSLNNATPQGGVAFRSASFNIYLGLSSIGSAKYNAIKAHILRLQPDFITLTEINSNDTASFNQLAIDCGFDYTERGDSATGSLQVAFMSKHPFDNVEMVDSPQGANEFIRRPIYLEVDVGHPTKKVAVYSIHTSSWCMQAPCENVPRMSLEFPRAIEWIRMTDHWNAKKLANPNLEAIFQGDWNDDNLSPMTNSFASEPSTAGYFVLGDDITFPVQYATYPTYQCDLGGLTWLDSVDLNGDRNTIWANTPNSAFIVAVKMDYIAHSGGIINQGHEILSSEADGPGGLKKYGSPLAFGDSRTASDHKCMFADFEI